MTVGFSQTFALKRHTLGKALRGFLNDPKMTKKRQMSALGRGSNEVEGYLRWLSIIGLRDNANHELTPIGRILAENDPDAENIGTQWILHYLLCSDPTPQGAEAWYHFTNHFLPLHQRFTRSELKIYLEEESGIRTDNKKGPAADMGLILGMYTSGEAFNELGIIQLMDKKEQSYLCLKPRKVPPMITSYVLYSQRERLYPESSSVSIPEILSADGNVGKIFIMDEARLNDVLISLQSKHYFHTMNFADLHHISFVFKGDPLDILRSYYEDKKQ